MNWPTTIFLISTLILTVTATPAYALFYGIDWYQWALFLSLFLATGLSITLGYHRLFSHRSFQAKWPVRLFVLLFGAASFEGSAISWVSDHRYHHKHVDHDEDPYDIRKGFFYAHMGWLFVKLQPERSLDNVRDLLSDPLCRWQHKFIVPVAFFVGFGLPTALGALHSGWIGALGGFLVGGVARVVAVQQMTFFINSLCHLVGAQPYSSRCTARDSWIMALFTFGEGYHNFHHEFQHDYRNGVKPWQWDPTKWTIWLLHRIGLVTNLRRVPSERILLAELVAAQHRIHSHLSRLPARDSMGRLVAAWYECLHQVAASLSTYREELSAALEEKKRLPQEALLMIRREIRLALAHLKPGTSLMAS
ncbi:stearoyl-CoA desaturase (Delta-9 desaturase) [Methylacidimicrobium cyclopophantes]|uniref:Stearoyl-CoA desaturase (Delta-9 desaturase) n=1 Tax=Methylacidimicrobium cyclopophantes TaxID=1041766 RepID=A0A5E6MBM5_9BACT|nr:fatty acid desaturase [Methylacidimicrobium cyclopophantes]VVM05165.1 stearoyl-CoA desaturase (Delta-9 desaturase) [Methylacidimicrobium cyclopophantes]